MPDHETHGIGRDVEPVRPAPGWLRAIVPGLVLLGLGLLALPFACVG